MQQDILACATGEFTLLRPGATPKQSLRAWDASDEYLIDFIFQHHKQAKLTIFNDQFGALGTALHPQIACWVSDSYCAQQALTLNLEHNQKTQHPLLAMPTSIWLNEPTIGVIKLPKNLSYLHYLLQGCQQAQISTLFIGGMMKHLPKNILGFLQKFGSVHRHPFKKKSTIYELQLEQVETSPFPKVNSFSSINLFTHANVFGRDKLDPGADFFLQHLKLLPGAENVADLCCGSGILGLKYASLNPCNKMDFYDESFMAVESARLSWDENTTNGSASFIWADGLSTPNTPKYDLILCNPPFHEQFTVGDHIAKRLFKDAKQCLSENGKLIVVGNRHLGYHVTLKKYFKHVEQIASNGKFVLLSAHA